MWREIRGAVVGNSDLVLCAVLVAIGLWLVKTLNHEKPDEAVVLATLAGALFGGVAVLLGNWINRANDRRRAASELDERRAKLKMLVAAELVNAAAGYLSTKQLIDSALESLYRTGGSLPDHAILTQYFPRDMPFTNRLGVELLILEKPAIDSLVTFQSNLTITRMRMEEAASGDVHLGLLRVGGIAAGLAHDMGILAECFDHIAPARKLKLTDKPAELASLLLRRASQHNPNATNTK